MTGASSSIVCRARVAAATAVMLLSSYAATGVASAGCCPDCVVVAVDLDPDMPGFQTARDVGAGTQWVRDVSIWIFDPGGSKPLHSIGFVGGLNRGLAFGHTPSAGEHEGSVVGITATELVPIVPGNTVFVNNGIEKLFAGPELQYFEMGPFGSPPGVIGSDPVSPVVTLDIELASAAPGDLFRFYLGDKTAEWLAGQEPGGAFSAQDVNSLESGGDACPDGTLTLAGLDPDVSVPVPPALYRVDYVDSGEGGGGAVVRVVSEIPTLPTRGVMTLLFLLATSAFLLISRGRMG